MKSRSHWTAFAMMLVMISFGLPVYGQSVAVDEATGDLTFASFGGESDEDYCGCGCCPTWTVGANAVFMDRSRPDPGVLLSTVAGMTLLDANGFDFDYEAGWDVSIGRQNCNGRGIEARFLSVDGWDAGQNLVIAPTAVVIPNPIPFVFPGVTDINATYDSELHSFELNLSQCLGDRVTVLGGFRYVEINEHYLLGLNAGAMPTTYDTQTRNRMYGGQLGARAMLWCGGRLSVDGNIKAGIYHNSSAQSTVLTTPAVFRAAERSDRASFLGELGLTGRYALNDCLSLQASYQLLWAETVTLATDQIPVTNFATAAGIDPAGGVFYHGGLIGLEYRR